MFIHGADESIQNLAKLLFPGFGYFGNNVYFSLSCPIKNVVDRIEVSIDSFKEEFLNIGPILFFGENQKELERESIIKSVSVQPSFRDKRAEEYYRNALNGALINSGKAKNPSLNIVLSEPMFLSALEIFNRSGRLGARSRYINLRCFSGGDLVYEYINMSGKRLVHELSELCKLAGYKEEFLDTERPAATIAYNIKMSLADKFRRDRLGLTSRQLVQLLPIFERSVCPSAFDISVCSQMVLSMMNGRKSLATKYLEPVGHILSTDYRIKRLEEDINRLARCVSQESTPYVISKHNINKSRLMSKKQQFLDAMQITVTLLEDWQLNPVICYGTLLGAVREKEFLPHDDDVDLLYFDGSTSKEEALEGKQLLIERLAAKGITCGTRPRWNFHPRVSGVVVDLFPSWVEGDHLYLMMEKGCFRGIPVSIMLPRSMISFQERRFPVPADPAAFLSERYGASWRESDPYHEWKWPLTRVSMPLPDIRQIRERRKNIPRKRLKRVCLVAWGQRVGRGKERPPKNTIPVIDRAKASGFDAIELDVRLSQDDVPVLAHDDRLFGPDGEITVSRASASELKRFCLGQYRNENVYVSTLEDALLRIGGCDVQIDPRVEPERLMRLRQAVDSVKFDEARLQFCVYGLPHAEALMRNFSQSVLLWKTYQEHNEIKDDLLDEIALFGLDGIMAKIPKLGSDYSKFIKKTKKRDLRVLFFILGEKGKSKPAGPGAHLKELAGAKVDYITTFLDDISTSTGLSS